jgi:hypothetical protein
VGDLSFPNRPDHELIYSNPQLNSLLLAAPRKVVVPLEHLAALLENLRHRHGVACCSWVIASGY